MVEMQTGGQGLWKSIQYLNLPDYYVPVPMKIAIASSVISALAAKVCSDRFISIVGDDVGVFTSLVQMMCSIRNAPTCDEVIGYLKKARQGRSLCKIVQDLLALPSNAAPSIRARHYALVATALAGVVLGTESFAPMDVVSKIIEEEEEVKP